MRHYRVYSLGLTTVAIALITQPVQAQASAKTNSIRRVKEVRPAKTLKEWMAESEGVGSREWGIGNREGLAQSPDSQLPTPNSPTQVTGVKVDRTDSGLDITLETGGKPLTIDASKFRTEGNALIADIPNTVLALPDGKPFEATSPATDISTIRVTQQDATTIRVSVVGNQTLPKTEVTLKTAGLAYSLNADEADDDELVVTGDRRTYSVPNASTATGTDTPILETPFSIQVVPQDVLRDQQVIRLEEALSNVSGVNFAGNDFGRQSTINVRGFGSQISGGAPVLRDGYRIYGNQAIPEIANLQRVEVLKGPSSILYGEIDPGGVINLVSKQPLAQPIYETELQVGSREFFRPRIDFTGPLTDDGTLLYRLNALFQNDRGFRAFDIATTRLAIAPVLRWRVSDRTDLTVNLEHIHQEGPADPGITKFGNGVAPVSRSFVANNPDDTLNTNYLSTGYNLEHRFSDNWKIRNGFRYISYDYNFGVIALPFFVEGADIIRFFALQEGQDRSYSLNTSVVGKFATGSVKHTLTIGADLNRSESKVFTLFGNPTPLNIFNPDYTLLPKPDRSELPLFGDNRTTGNRLGIYLQDQIYLLDNLILVAGVRYDTITQKTNNVETAFTQGGQSERTDDAFTPRVGLLYRPIPELSLFANYSQSFKPSTANTEDGTLLQPERGEGFEVGVKTELFNQKLLTTFTYFDITKKNISVTDPNNPLFSVALGEQKSRGIEFDIAGELTPGWKVIGSYTHINAKVSKDTDETIVGNRLFGVPQNKAGLWTTYEIQQGSLKGLGFGAGLEYVSDRFGDLANSFRVGDYLIGNAAIYYRRDNYRFAVNLRNISNASYIRALTGNEGGLEPGAPFTVIGSFSISF